MAEGSIFREVAKDGAVSWRIRVSLTDPVTGKRHQPQRTYRTKRQAEHALRQWLLDVEHGIVGKPERVTVGDLLRSWLDDWAAPYRAIDHAGRLQGNCTGPSPAHTRWH